MPEAADAPARSDRPRQTFAFASVSARMSRPLDGRPGAAPKPKAPKPRAVPVANFRSEDQRGHSNGYGPAVSGATPSRGDTPTPQTSSGVPAPGTIPVVGRSRPRKPNRNEVISGDPTVKLDREGSASLGPTNKMPARQHGRRATDPPEQPRGPASSLLCTGPTRAADLPAWVRVSTCGSPWPFSSRTKPHPR